MTRYISNLDGSANPVRDVTQVSRKAQGTGCDIQLMSPLQTASKASWINAVESQVPTGRPKGYKGTLDNTSPGERKYVRKASHIADVRDWVAFHRQVLQKWHSEQGPNPDLDAPLPFTVCEFGWTHTQAKRRYDHGSHNNSVRLMNLVECICRHNFGTKFGVEFMAFYQPPFAQLVPMAEHVLTRLGGGYAWEGGFNSAIAGIATNSALQIKNKVYEKIQNKHEAQYVVRMDTETEQTSERLDFLVKSSQEKENKEWYASQKAQREAEETKFITADDRLAKAYDELDDAVDDYLDMNMVRRLAVIAEGAEWLEDFAEDMEKLDMLERRDRAAGS